jgi:hypothetical protein
LGGDVVVGGAEVLDDLVHSTRKLAVAWLEWACGHPYADSVPETDQRYQIVTEGRDKPTKGYSSCADLAHWMLYRVGVRLPWINRAEHQGWRDQVNVSRLCAHSVPWTPLADVQGGDIVVIANRWPSGYDAHVVCVIDDNGDGTWATAEYGQPGGALCQRRVQSGVMGYRRIRVWLPLGRVLGEACAVGQLVAAEVPPPEIEPSELPTMPGTPRAKSP